MRPGRLLFAISGIALTGAVFRFLPPNLFDKRPLHEICFDLEGSVSQTIPACTALIESGKYSGWELSAIYAERANSFHSAGKLSAAIADYTESLRVDPDAAIYEVRGALYEQAGEPERALADYSEAIRLDPHRSSGYGSRADLWMKQGEYEKAVADFTEDIKYHHPATVVYPYWRRAQAYVKLGRENEAFADLTKAIESYPEAASALIDRAALSEKRGEVEKAVADYRAALRARPYDVTSTSALKRLGVMP